MKAWEKRFTLREPRFFSTWLTRILINECHNIQRKRRPSLPMAEELLPAAPAPDPTLSMLVQNLPEKLRLPLVMQAMEGMSCAEIARALHLPRSTIIGRIQRAKQQLRKEMEG